MSQRNLKYFEKAQQSFRSILDHTIKETQNKNFLN